MKRRKILKGLGSLSALGLTGLGTYSCVSKEKEHFKIEIREKPAVVPKLGNERTIKLGIIGFGIRGEQLVKASGFPVSEQMVESQPSLNIEYTAICDLFDIRASKAQEAVGKQAKRYKHYQDLLNSDIDAVIIATPDHWHAPMVIDAIKAGKHVYVEKCLTRTLKEVYDVYNTVKNSGYVFQLGHQLRHTESYHAAKEVIRKNLLGDISLIQTNSNRNSKNGAWIYNIPLDATLNTIDWAQFNHQNASRPFDPDRFFRWRKYWDYGTGIFGDLMTHDFDAVNQIIGMGIPESLVTSGGVYFWKDGRQVPDVVQVVMEYPSRNFTYQYSATQSNEYHRPNIIMGNDATMEIGDKMTIHPDPRSTKFQDKLSQGLIGSSAPSQNSDTANQQLDGISSATTKYFEKKGMLYTYKNGKRISPTYLHIKEWLDCIRNGGTTSCNIDQAFEEAITAQMAVISYKEQRTVKWDNKKKVIV
ncbi:Gfo/Idh/MocA family oxidoreductase [Fulvivirgaceae bacterium BMA10]|uniref:Gfo/Idh/MocA family oxidoreductase n=1 Tax=Splendidivirga corallicola TaxID=3051826 RepID=A0ABT8KUC5_9BACT|nr:Gfo/Idh/MocA family oxidoreductase [Fulvivirgaceae bacterium BMA10]